MDTELPVLVRVYSYQAEVEEKMKKDQRTSKNY